MKHSSETGSQARFKQRLSSPEILKVRHRIRGKNAHVIAWGSHASNRTASVSTIQKRHLLLVIIQQNACYPLNWITGAVR